MASLAIVAEKRKGYILEQNIKILKGVPNGKSVMQKCIPAITEPRQVIDLIDF